MSNSFIDFYEDDILDDDIDEESKESGLYYINHSDIVESDLDFKQPTPKKDMSHKTPPKSGNKSKNPVKKTPDNSDDSSEDLDYDEVIPDSSDHVSEEDSPMAVGTGATRDLFSTSGANKTAAFGEEKKPNQFLNQFHTNTVKEEPKPAPVQDPEPKSESDAEESIHDDGKNHI